MLTQADTPLTSGHGGLSCLVLAVLQLVDWLVVQSIDKVVTCHFFVVAGKWVQGETKQTKPGKHWVNTTGTRLPTNRVGNPADIDAIDPATEISVLSKFIALLSLHFLPKMSAYPNLFLYSGIPR